MQVVNQYKLCPVVLGQMSVKQPDQTSKTRGFQINTKRPLVHLKGVKALKVVKPLSPCGFSFQK